MCVLSVCHQLRGMPADSGWVRFEQPADNPLADVTVVINITGLTAGQHGFHVHQFGDVRITTDLSSMSAHFVPFCIPAEIDVEGGGVQTGTGCEADQIHGIPPALIRQPGDMGNLVVGATRTVLQTLTMGQQKMSLTDPLRSIVGRVIVVHSLVDDASQPYGNAGAPQAYGVIGMARPVTGVANAVLAPTTPQVDKIICTFEGAYQGEPLCRVCLSVRRRKLGAVQHMLDSPCALFTPPVRTA